MKIFEKLCLYIVRAQVTVLPIVYVIVYLIDLIFFEKRVYNWFFDEVADLKFFAIYFSPWLVMLILACFEKEKPDETEKSKSKVANEIRTPWDNYSPGELKKAKKLSIAFMFISILIAVFIHIWVGLALLGIGLYFGLAPFLLGSKDSIRNISYVLKKIESGYASWDDDEIDRQVEVILECGYKWHEAKGRGGFIHSQSGIILKIDGLCSYSPEEIRDTYERVWSKESLQSIKALESSRFNDEP